MPVLFSQEFGIVREAVVLNQVEVDTTEHFLPACAIQRYEYEIAAGLRGTGKVERYEDEREQKAATDHTGQATNILVARFCDLSLLQRTTRGLEYRLQCRNVLNLRCVQLKATYVRIDVTRIGVIQCALRIGRHASRW